MSAKSIKIMNRTRLSLPITPELPACYFDMGKRETWEKGQTIFRPEPATGLYLLSAGNVRLTHRYIVGGKKCRKLLFTITPPGLVFEARCIFGVNPDLEAVVVARAKTTYLDIASVEEFMNDDPVFHAFITASITYKQGVLIRSALWNSAGQTTEALLDLLHEHARERGRRTADGRVRVSVDRQALGEELGIHPRTLIRWLNELEKKGEIELWRGGVTLRNPGRWKMTQGTRNLVDRVPVDGGRRSEKKS